MHPSDFFRRSVVLSFQENTIGIRLRDVARRRLGTGSYLPIGASAFSIVGCSLHAPHSGALSQIVAKSWLE